MYVIPLRALMEELVMLRMGLHFVLVSMDLSEKNANVSNHLIYHK